MIIDSHVHVFPDSIAAHAVANLQRHSPHPLASDGTLNGLLLSMERSGISRAITLPVSTKPAQVQGINRFAVRLGRRKEIISFGTIHPDYAQFRDEIKCLADTGIRGVKMHPDYQAFDADEPRLFPIYEALAEEGLVLYLHAGENINISAPPRCTPLKLAAIAKRVPPLKIIAAHLGGWRMWDEVERYLSGAPVWMDTSFTLGHIPAARFLDIVRNHGVDQVVFGSDFPWNDQGDALQRLLKLPLSAREKKSILGGNAAGLAG